MGFFDDLKAIKSVQKIKNGGKEKLSISQITGLITNMYDASKNLDRDTYKRVYSLFTDLRKCNTKMEMDLKGYHMTAIDIIKRFDAIAPYEKYSGGNELEFSFFMDDIRNDSQSIIEESIQLSNEEIEYANTIKESSLGSVDDDIAREFVKIIKIYSLFGKNKALEKFDILAKKCIEKDATKAVMINSFLLGALNANGVIEKTEMDELGNKYQEIVINVLTKKN